MADDQSDREAPTRRDYVKYGGAAIGGGLFAGCTGQSDPGSSPTDASAGNESTGSETPVPEEDSYTVSMAPVGEVSFEQPPETVFTVLPHHADMVTAAGHGEAVASMMYNKGYNDTIWNKFLERIPGVSVDWADLPGTWNPGKERLYELDSDLHLADPAYMTNMQNWTRDDIEEVAENVSPWFGNTLSNANKEPASEWAADYEYYTLWEIFENVAAVFQAEDRYEALAEVHTEMLSTIETNLPPEDERPTVAMVILIGGKDSLYVYALNGPGFLTAHTRPLGAEDVFADIPTESTVDFEALIEADPDVILCLAGMSESRHVERTRERLASNQATQSLSAVQNERIYTQGGRYQGPIMNLFQTEMAAKQLYPDVFGEWPPYTDGPYPEIPESERLFDRQRVADIINGDF
ncbi:iron complex transport system substrate-binding protein [Halorubrum trapanicum]|uniref:Iron complex transport system substrate-binding protein n=1 Tax=Halorubrum trapanicum TaxID=29284 RepID=A0A8J7UNJ3_9EURY|nr:ABC transporter substrate-binding protein [Halorubrum trapanicum]MBP1901921.1 iron complex transport system substrate-binding protein [Halorubrum trapanicum]